MNDNERETLRTAKRIIWKHFKSAMWHLFVEIMRFIFTFIVGFILIFATVLFTIITKDNGYYDGTFLVAVIAVSIGVTVDRFKYYYAPIINKRKRGRYYGRVYH